MLEEQTPIVTKKPPAMWHAWETAPNASTMNGGYILYERGTIKLCLTNDSGQYIDDKLILSGVSFLFHVTGEITRKGMKKGKHVSHSTCHLSCHYFPAHVLNVLPFWSILYLLWVFFEELFLGIENTRIAGLAQVNFFLMSLDLEVWWKPLLTNCICIIFLLSCKPLEKWVKLLFPRLH